MPAFKARADPVGPALTVDVFERRYFFRQSAVTMTK